MDIDIDSADRELILKLIRNVPASIYRKDEIIKHNTGVYVTDIPVDYSTGLCTIDHKKSGDMGYIKLDFLNVNVYNRVQDHKHLDRLITQSRYGIALLTEVL